MPVAAQRRNDNSKVDRETDEKERTLRLFFKISVIGRAWSGIVRVSLMIFAPGYVLYVSGLCSQSR